LISGQGTRLPRDRAGSRSNKATKGRMTMPILLWLLGIPIPIIILLLLLWH
jgi:hypothetical protein